MQYWFRNIPFEMVPSHLIEAIKEKPFTLAEYYSNCALFNHSPFYWNSALIKDQQVLGFVWGTFSPLHKTLFIDHITVDKRLQSVSGIVIKFAVKETKEIALEKGLERIYFFSFRPKVFKRKLFAVAKQVEGLMEVA